MYRRLIATCSIGAALLAVLASCPDPEVSPNNYSPAPAPTHSEPPTVTLPVPTTPVKTATLPSKSGGVKVPLPTSPKKTTDIGVEPATPTLYSNCTDLRKDYPNGVPNTHPAYRKKLDRDNDGRACEVN